MTEPELEGKCEHGRNLVRTYCPCFILRITLDKLLASQKSDLLAKVLEIISSTCIGDNTATKFREKIKKRIEELA